jgi:hypothetical protein
MDALAYPIFSGLSATIRTLFFETMDLAYDEMLRSVVKIAVLIETIFIIRAGYIILSRKTSEDEKNPDVQELLYHLTVVCAVLAFLKTGRSSLDFIIGLKTMLIAGLTGITGMSGGQQMDASLAAMNLAMSLGAALSRIDSTYTSELKATMITLALNFTVSPPITGALLLLFNELMVRLGVALFPLAAYAALYKSTRDIFNTWVGLMAALGVLMATSAVTIKVMTVVTTAFVTFFVTLQAITSKLPVGSWYISEIQQSVIQAGFGFTLTIVILNFPVNAAAFVGGYLQFAGPTLNNELGALYKSKQKVSSR